MAVVIHVFGSETFLGGVGYRAQVVGREAGHIWEGWIEFASADGGDLRRTERETTQPHREALEYWATGISGTYLEGALARTVVQPAREPGVTAPPLFNAPAPSVTIPPTDRAVLDPFSVGAKGETILRQELSALRAWHLRNIVRAYGLAQEDLDLEALSEPELVEIIVAGVETA